MNIATTDATMRINYVNGITDDVVNNIIGILAFNLTSEKKSVLFFLTFYLFLYVFV